MKINTLVLLNSSSPAYRQGTEYILPYLDHFGIPYTPWDLHRAPLPADVGDYTLVVIAHPQINPGSHQLDRKRLFTAVEGGTGLVSFDAACRDKASGSLALLINSNPVPDAAAVFAADRPLPVGVTGITFGQPHPITARHAPGETIAFAANLPLPDNQPFLAASHLGAGHIIQWASAEWMDTHILGPLSGLDDVLWRSLVWAARKPCVLRGLPPIVTMRVDDVAGTGHLWGQSPLGWVHTANRYGFKPWLGLFLYNLTEPAIDELRDLLLAGKATAFPHAFGRPPRPLTPNSLSPNPCPYYYPSALPPRSSTYDEFIYFDHAHAHPLDDAEAARGLAAVDEWYAAHTPLPMSRYAIAHWGEMGSNTIAHVRDRWGSDFFANYHDLDAPLEGANWLPGGPFRQHEQPGSALFDCSDRGNCPVYYADFINLADRQFFFCLTEIRDETGYEWAPDSDVEASAGRGLRQLQRALDSFALPVLFTHETDYIYKISPEAWQAQLSRISAGIAGHRPIYVTLDEGIRCVRATKTSRLDSASYDPATGQVTACFRGHADVPTGFYVFRQDDLTSTFVEVPPFGGEWNQTV